MRVEYLLEFLIDLFPVRQQLVELRLAEDASQRRLGSWLVA